MLAARGGVGPLRILSLPCSTGEEPYSIALRLLEEWDRIADVDVEIHGADWREVAKVVLKIDPANKPQRARRAWESHLARARLDQQEQKTLQPLDNPVGPKV